MKIVILAGGGGTRLWPASRERLPKQVLPILGKDTLLQRTYKRLRTGFASQDILVAAGEQYRSAIIKQLPALPRANLLLEPVRRDSAGAIGLAAACISRDHPQEIMLSVHADHWVENDAEYVYTLKRAGQLAEQYHDQTIMVGIKPLYPETGLGYIQVSKKVVQAYKVKKFIEKPPLAAAERFVKAPDYFWNTGWFAWRVDNLLDLYKKYLPDNFAALQKIIAAPPARLASVIKKEFPRLTSISIDQGISEKTNKILMVASSLGWADIGHWRSVQEMSAKDKNGNVVNGTSLLLDSANNLFFTQSKKLIAAIGVSNLVVVETNDALLLVDKKRAQEVKQLVDELKKKKNLRKYL